MNTPSSRDPQVIAATRPLYWSVRRELWENRSIYIAPLAVAALGLFGFLIALIKRPKRRGTGGDQPVVQAHRARHALQPPCDAASA